MRIDCKLCVRTERKLTLCLPVLNNEFKTNKKKMAETIRITNVRLPVKKRIRNH